MTTLQGKRIVLGVSGGIAAYKAIEVCRRLVDAGAHVTPILTKAAEQMIGTTTISALASEPARTALFGDLYTPIPHTKIGQAADLLLVAPATARVISDLRVGRSADLLTATLLASRAPLVICPAMHTEMWEQQSVQENISVLAARGARLVGPESGLLAGGDSGVGRMAEPTEIVDAARFALQPDYLRAKRVLVTAGGTREPIDAVRFIGNRSSGKQGHAFAQVAANQGAEVVLITTENHSTRKNVRILNVATAAEMHQVCVQEAPQADLVVMAAAVADFRPKHRVGHKLKKAQGIPHLELEATEDILAELGKQKPRGQILVGFAAETNDLAQNAQEKLRLKNLDMIVANDVSVAGAGFDHDTNIVSIYLPDSPPTNLPLSTKTTVAEVVLNAAAKLFNQADKEPK